MVKTGDIKYRRNVFTAKWVAAVLIATTAYYRWEKLGHVEGAVFDNVQEPKLSVKSEVEERGGVGVYESILIRPPRFCRATAACCLQMRY